MYPYYYPTFGVVSPCYYCTIGNRPSVPERNKSMMRGSEELVEDRVSPGGMTQPTHQMQGMGQQMPGMGQQMPGMGQQMPGMTDMSQMNMGKINADTQEIVRMFEMHHPDIISTLTGTGMSMGQARQFLTRVVQMTLMHHMMHQM